MYLNFFGFTEEPFNPTPDPDFLYLSDTHREALAAMISAIKKRLGTITITGEVGTGKTTLVYTLLKALEKNVRAAFIFNPRINLEDLLKSILLDLGAPVPEPSLYALLQTFNLNLKERLPNDETVAIVIDEAQNMSMEVLEGINRLSKRETPASKLLQIIIVGQPELEKNLDSPGLREFKKRISIRQRLSPLTPEETKRYIDHRLRVAGSSSAKVFTPRAVDKVYKYSQGIPRVINHLCDHSLLTGYALSVRKIDPKIVKDVIKSKPHWLSRPRARFPRLKPVRFLAASAGLAALFLGGIYLLNQGWNMGTPPKERRVYTAKISQSQVIAKPSPAKEAPRKEPEFQVVRMQPGWSLSILAKRHYQSMHLTFKDFILEANPHITDANIIHVNDEIKVPVITEESLLIPSPDQTYQIYLGTFKGPQFLKDFENQPPLKGKSLQVVRRKVSPQETWYRFVAGSFADKEEGLEAIRKLRETRMLPAFSDQKG